MAKCPKSPRSDDPADVFDDQDELARIIERIRTAISMTGQTCAPLTESERADLTRNFPNAPKLFVEIASLFGPFDLNGFRLYGGLVDPTEIYDEGSWGELSSLAIFGDDRQGTCYAFATGNLWQVVAIDASTGTATSVADDLASFLENELHL